MRNFFGILILSICFFFSLGCAFLVGEDFVGAIVLLIIIGLPIYILGQIIRTSKEMFIKNKKTWIFGYFFYFLVIPGTLNVLVFFDDIKRRIFHADQYIIFHTYSSSFLGVLSFLSAGIFLALVGYRLFGPDQKRIRLVNISLICMLVFLIGFNYMVLNDYRGIHQEDGLVRNNWLGVKTVIPLDHVNYIYVEPMVHLTVWNSSTSFQWKVYFVYDHEQEEEEYHFTMIREEALENTIAIRELAQEGQIPFIVNQMSDYTYSWFELDLELEGLDEERYYELFNVPQK